MDHGGRVRAASREKGTVPSQLCCFAGTLWLGNAAYLYLSVSFIQMLKALMPVAVFTVGCGMGTESYSSNTLLNMIVVTIGVAIASYGEINFVVIGVVLQLLSVMTESTRLTLVGCAAPAGACLVTCSSTCSNCLGKLCLGLFRTRMFPRRLASTSALPSRLSRLLSPSCAVPSPGGTATGSRCEGTG